MKPTTKISFSMVLLLNALMILSTTHVFAQWSYTGTPNGSVFSFPNASTGFVTADGIVRKTTNAGVSWQTVLDLQLFYGESLGLFFTTPEKGFLSADDNKLYRTTNSGILWKEVIDMRSSGRQIFFVDQLHGWARNYSNFYRTTDGGVTWTPHQFGFYATVCNLFFINAKVGWVGNYNNLSTTVQKTTNGGLTWIAKQNVDAIFYDMHFVNELTGWGAGYSGQIFKTTDGGETWNEQNSNVGHTIDKIFMIDANTGWAGTDYSWSGTSHMVYTTNGGTHWIPVVKPENSRVTDLKFFQNTGVGYLIMGGKLYKTSNNGILNTMSSSDNNLPGKFSLKQNYPNPFNPSTKIKFELNEPGFVTLKIFDMAGKEVTTLISAEMTAGEYEHNFNAEGLSSGVYYMKLSNGSQSEVRKMSLLK